MGTDVLAWYQVSAQSGHVGPGSSTPYINSLEGPMAAVSRNARPKAWSGLPLCGSGYAVFPEIGEGLLGIRPPMPPRMTGKPQATESTQVDLMARERILWGIINQQKFSSVASACDLSEDLVKKVLGELVELLVQLHLVDSELLGSPRKQCLAVCAFFLWARAGRQVKYREISRYLNSECRIDNLKKMQTMWRDWSLCQHQNFISLSNPRPAARFTAALVEAGVNKKQMVVLSADDAAPLSGQIKATNISCRPCEPRALRAGHRLFFVPHGVDPVTANAATLSVVGLHWWMLLLGSFLVAKGEI